MHNELNTKIDSKKKFKWKSNKEEKRIKNNYNKLLNLQGIVLTMYDKRNKISELVAQDVKNFFKEKVYKQSFQEM